MKKLSKKASSSLTPITALFSLTVLVIWGISMYCITAITAEYAAARYLDTYKDFSSTLSEISFSFWLGKGFDQEYANYDANRMWEAVDIGGQADTFTISRAVAAGNSGFLSLPDSDNV